MESARWVNQSQPQMLVTGTIWLYLRAVFGVIFGASLFGLVFAGGYAAAGFGIANEKRWGLRLGIGLAGLVCFVAVANLLSIVHLSYFSNSTGFAIISLMFDAALFAMLVHPSSRSYAKVWFS